MTSLVVEPHPLLDFRAFIARFPQPLGELGDHPTIRALLTHGTDAPLSSDEKVRSEVRELLRHGGFKPTGRSRPASEYLIKAVEADTLGPINLAVDAGNAVSLHSGLPISVVDVDRAKPPWRVAVCPSGTHYIFNAGGQEIDVGGLITLHDADGPCAGPVKDSHRTKTTPSTTTTLNIIWGTRALDDRTERALQWYLELMRTLGVDVSPVESRPGQA